MTLTSGPAPISVQRGWEYARCAFALRQDLTSAGAEALYDHALNNGLAVIVATAWPDAELQPVERKASTPGALRVKPASELLKTLVEKAESHTVTVSGDRPAATQVRVTDIQLSSDSDGEPQVVTMTASTLGENDPPTTTFFFGENQEEQIVPADTVTINVAVLREAIEIVHPVRHGRARTGSLEQRHLDALLALDEHPRLQGLDGLEVDASYVEDKARDLWLWDNAVDYLELLSDDEIARRVEAADAHAHRSAAEWGLQSCPVCNNETLIPTHIDDFGLGIGVGTCFVCGFWRSQRAVDEESQNMMWELHHKYD
ncbi:hypothetical protein [Amycolatopsis dendrobii]|uniref:Uncharacterized protein n=1 Tax=Amycolatopsis dendrobii TaxID=2760662 RepID=A0A7W3Z9D6_9PSEU|nr:hypothetical protein [Amycolatopsis dendrobii]MBB1152503.1 hypothetical protein [Amycolatopsis dendrobii]